MPKIVFKNPSKNKVVVFDEEGSLIIKMMILIDLKYTIVHSRREIIHITLPLLYLMIRNAIIFIRKRSFNLKGVKKSSLLGCIYKIYLFSIIDYIKPRVVITWIYNSRAFHWISRRYNGCEFYAIQHGISTIAKRLHYDENADFGEKSEGFSPDVMSFPHFFCFGQYDLYLYTINGHDVDNFYPVGPLIGGFYKTRISGKNTKVEFDICLVSYHPSFPEGQTPSKSELGVGYLHKLVHKYVAEERLSCCIAMKSTDKHEQIIEKEYFVNILGDSVTIIKRNERDMLATYAAMARSSIIVASYSTAAFEVFGWGKKVLFCNLSGDDFNQLPLPEICKMNVNKYEIFKSKLDHLRQLDENEYREITQSHARYLMNYDFENPAHTVIRKMILEHLS